MARGFVWNGKEYRASELCFQTIEQIDAYLESCRRTGVEIENAGMSGDPLGGIVLHVSGWYPVPAECFATFC